MALNEVAIITSKGNNQKIRYAGLSSYQALARKYAIPRAARNWNANRRIG